MTSSVAPDNRVLQAIERLKAFDRRGAVALLKDDLAQNSAPGDRWRSIARLSFTIGELKLSHEAARRYAEITRRLNAAVPGRTAGRPDGMGQPAAHQSE